MFEYTFEFHYWNSVSAHYSLDRKPKFKGAKRNRDGYCSCNAWLIIHYVNVYVLKSLGNSKIRQDCALASLFAYYFIMFFI